MLTAFSTALTALNGQSVGIDVVGNNLANLSTTGFKASTTVFHDLVSQSLGADGSTQLGMGLATPSTERVFSQGAIQTSSGDYDAAIQGSGFFIVHGSSGTAQSADLYTRAGSFKVDSAGYLVTTTGERVQGYGISGGQVSSTRGDIVIPFSKQHGPQPTSTVGIGMNLDSTDPVLSPIADPTGVATGTDVRFNKPSYSTSVEVYDQQGASHMVDVDFWKTGANTWKLDSTIDGTPSNSPIDIAFKSDGTLDTANSSATSLNLSGNGISANFNLLDASGSSTVTQFASNSSATSILQDGHAPGTLVKAAIANNGYVELQYSDGSTENAAVLAVAAFKNPDSLIAVGNNDFKASGQTSAPLVQGADQSSSKVFGGSLESSTVDIASEFTNLMVYQRGYQANAKVITTADQINQDTINLIR